jgi:anionic cell wall polymer biosynthesis LytR-Cps2A-Psr (LCP) family protein
MKDKYTGLDIPEAGVKHLDGVTALQFARARHVVGTDGSDLTRIGNQQRLLSAVMTEVLSKNVVTDVPQLLSFMSAATSSLTMDDGLTLQAMVGLAYSARGLQSGGLTFLTIPNGPDPADKNRVVWTSDADAVWSNLAQDVPVLGQPTPADPPATDPGASDPASGQGAAPGTQAPPATNAPAVPTTPTPTETKTAGRDPFTGADVTAVC